MEEWKQILTVVSGIVGVGAGAFAIYYARQFSNRVNKINSRAREDYHAKLQQKGADLDARLGAIPSPYQQEAAQIAMMTHHEVWSIPSEISSVLSKYASPPKG